MNNNYKEKVKSKKLLATFLGGFWVLCILTTVLVSFCDNVSPLLILIPCMLTLFSIFVVGIFVLIALKIMRKTPKTEEKAV